MVDISGGSNSKKYLLSPHQFSSQFLLCLQGSSAAVSVSDSFHKDYKDYEEGDVKSIDYSPKKTQEFIIDFTRTHDYLKTRILSDNTEIFNGIKDYLNKQNKKNTNFTINEALNDSSAITSNNENSAITSNNDSNNDINSETVIRTDTEQPTQTVLDKHTPAPHSALARENNNYVKNNEDMNRELGKRKFHSSNVYLNLIN